MFVMPRAFPAAMAAVGMFVTSLAHSEEVLLRPPESAIIKMPLAQLEPPRGVPAKDWKSSFCALWDDGCTRCTRLDRDGPIRCADKQHAGSCQRHAVVCWGEIDHANFLRVCKRPADEWYWKMKDGRIVAETVERRVDWISDVNGVFPMKKRLGETSTPGLILAIRDTGFSVFTLQGYKPRDSEPIPLNNPAFGASVPGIRCVGTYDGQ